MLRDSEKTANCEVDASSWHEDDCQPHGENVAARLTTLAAAVAMTSCGGGGGSGDSSSGGTTPTPAPPASSGYRFTSAQSREEAARFLMQTTFGVTESAIDRVMSLGYEAWIDEQLDSAKTPPVQLMSYINRIDPNGAGTNVYDLLAAFYQNVGGGQSPVRDRVAFELSKIFVVSSLYFLDGGRLASYYDMLSAKGTTTFRQLLEGVTLHPTMGVYLSSLANQKENDQGRIPDQNFAREVQQLFSIGLYQLNPDGTHKLDASGNFIPTYTQDDIIGLSRVFTGYSWSGPDQSDGRFFYGGQDHHPAEWFEPMQFYPQFHSTMEKKFLGVTIPAGGGGASDLALALDTLANHSSTAPNISRQLIQRFITSNPSAAYVGRVSAVFTSSGGDMKSVLKSIFLDDEARDPANASSNSFGKVREPMLRIYSLWRAFGVSSDSGRYTTWVDDDPATGYGQVPLRAPSVFNFYRPTYAPPLSRTAQQGLVAPEMQILHEVSIVGYANTLAANLAGGFGAYGDKGRPNIRLPFNDNTTTEEFNASEFAAIADSASEIVTLINRRLFAGQMASALSSRISTAIDRIAVPALAADQSNAAAVASARRARVKVAVYLAMVSPQFHVQR